jgi:hypothetical protein
VTYTIKTRGSGGPLMAEYMCPEHGRVEIVVMRDEKGDPPTEAKCMEWLENADLNHPSYPHPAVYCGEWAPFVISAPGIMKDSVPCRAVVRGGDTERRPGMLDTRPLAEGMPMSEWKKVQKSHADERRHQKLIKKGMKQKRIQVG